MDAALLRGALANRRIGIEAADGTLIRIFGKAHSGEIESALECSGALIARTMVGTYAREIVADDSKISGHVVSIDAHIEFEKSEARETIGLKLAGSYRGILSCARDIAMKDMSEFVRKNRIQ